MWILWRGKGSHAYLITVRLLELVLITALTESELHISWHVGLFLRQINIIWLLKGANCGFFCHFDASELHFKCKTYARTHKKAVKTVNKCYNTMKTRKTEPKKLLLFMSLTKLSLWHLQNLILSQLRVLSALWMQKKSWRKTCGSVQNLNVCSFKIWYFLCR